MSDERDIQIIRPNSLAVSWQTKKGLAYVARALQMPNADALAEQVLSTWLKEIHPSVVAHMKKRYSEDQDFEKQLHQSLKV